LAASAQVALDFRNQFPTDQAMALSGLFTQMSTLNIAATPLSTASMFTQTTASSSNAAAVGATSRAGATVTSYKVGVSQLAVAQVDTSNSFASAALQTAGVNINAGSNTVGVSIGGAQAQADYFINGGISSQEALTALAEAINSIATNNAIQRITINNAGSGTFSLTFNGQTTAAIAYDAPATGAGSVQSALGALASVGGNANVNVTKTATNSYVVAFTGALANQPLPKLQANTGTLNSGASIAVDTLGPT